MLFRTLHRLASLTAILISLSCAVRADTQFTWISTNSSGFIQVRDSAIDSGNVRGGDITAFEVQHSAFGTLGMPVAISGTVALSPDRSTFLGGSLQFSYLPNVNGEPISVAIDFLADGTQLMRFQSQPFFDVTLSGAYTGGIQSQQIHSNLGPANAYASSFFTSTNSPWSAIAVPFYSPPLNLQWRVSSVTLPINAVSTTTNSNLVLLAPDEAGSPGVPIETLTMIFSHLPGLATMNSSSDTPLEPSRRYWLIVPLDGVPIEWRHSPNGETGRFLVKVGQSWIEPPPGALLPGYSVAGASVFGACCVQSARCLVLAPGTCTSLAGQYQGHYTTCIPQTCAAVPLTGACCQGSTCQTTTLAACASVSGFYLGDGQTCSPSALGGPLNPCCRADFNNSGSASVQDLFDFLTTFFNGCP